jgi:hypothetical protein
VGSGSGQKPGRNFFFFQGGQKPTCPNCRRSHAGDCRIGTGTCFHCVKTCHFIKDCPAATTGGAWPHGGINQQGQKPLIQARVYALTLGRADTKAEEAEVVTGTLLLFGRHACTLFNSGATHSFISSIYVKMCSINTKILE